MAALRMAFKAWLDGEPEEPNTDRPSEEQVHQYEQAEKEHQKLVSRMILEIIAFRGCHSARSSHLSPIPVSLG